MRKTAKTARPVAARAGLLVGLLSFVALGLAWALASAPSSSPDDNFHLPSIWCAWGEQDSGCYQEEGTTLPRPWATIPPLDTSSSRCYAFKGQESAVCQEEPVVSNALDQAWTTNTTQYPGGYYSVMRLFVSDHVGLSHISIRMASYLVSLGLVLLALIPFGRTERARILLFVLAPSVPMGLFLAASSNPSGPAIYGILAFLLGTVAFLRSTGTRAQLTSAAVAAASLAWAGMARPDSRYFAVVILSMALILALHRRNLTGQTLLLGLPVFAVFAVLAAQALIGASSGSSTLPGSAAEGEQSAGVAILSNIIELPGLIFGEYPINLAWFDTPMPALAWGLRDLTLGMILAVGISTIRWRRLAAFLLPLAAGAGAALLILQNGGYRVGEWVQPRYLLPLVVAAVAVLALRGPHDRTRITRRQATVLAVLISVVHAVALHTLIRRFVTGNDVIAFDLNANAEWWWNIPVGPMAVWAVGSLAMIAICALLAVQASAGEESDGAARVTAAPTAHRPDSAETVDSDPQPPAGASHSEAGPGVHADVLRS